MKRSWQPGPVATAAGVCTLVGTICAGAAAQVPPLDTQRVASGLTTPIFAGSPPGDANRLFVAEQGSGSTANIRILNLGNNALNPTPFLTVGGLSTGGERGLLGLAFHPNYSANGLFYVNVTNTAGHTEIREYMRSGNPDLATATPTRTLLTINQPQSNHNGGWIGFSPRAGDGGNLYIATGDGGGGDDNDAGHAPEGNGQSKATLLGKVLRINVDRDDFPADAARNYGVPAGNPFSGAGEAREIFAYGLRNPFRASFDRGTGHMYIGDVGQSAREEVDFQSANRPNGGENYGWRLREGTIATPTPSANPVGGPPPADNVEPIDDYPRTIGTTITGGYVYRGTDIPGLQGAYVYGDFGSGRLFMLRHDGTGVTLPRTEITADLAGAGLTIDNPSSFGEDGRGELYIVDYDGEIYRVTPEPAGAGLLLAGVAAAALRRRRAAPAV